MNNTLTALKGVKVGHSTHLDKLTGTTVVLFENDSPMAYKSYGGDPGTFNTDALRNGRSDNRVHAIFISGGSWAGLTAGGKNLEGLIKSIGFFGIREKKGRKYYWKLVLSTLFKHPRAFPLSISLSVFGFHFRKVSEQMRDNRIKSGQPS